MTINSLMNAENKTPPVPPQAPQKKPDEKSGFTVEGVVRIYDPQSQKVYVEKRI